MFLSLNWLKDFVNIPKSLNPQELGRLLTMHTVEIDGIEKQADKFKNIVVGKILEIKKHPNADRLQIAIVDIGKAKLHIVCGAPNINKGQLVPVAKVGAVLPNGLEIKEAEIRGEKSFGMLCAEDELGLGDDHSGIMILNDKAQIGQNLADYLNLNDVIFEVDNKSITHRPDLWSHYGMAREISAFLDVDFKEIKNKEVITEEEKIKITVRVDDFSVCPRYMGLAIGNIKIGPSPQWIQTRLIASGIRPINNVVDLTNYIMLELGQPLHAFDLKRIREDNKVEIFVRKAKEEEIETLDGEERKLDNDILVIANKSNPIAIAGIMGGANSEINDNTTEILLEAANFNFITIRKASKKLGLRTESSMRFEKSLDPNLVESAVKRFVELLKEICPEAKVISKLIDEKKFTLKQGPIDLDLGWLENYIGEKINTKDVKKILEKLGFKILELENQLKVTVPSWRATKDISSKEDLAEEVVRIYGYNNIKPIAPKAEMIVPDIDKTRYLERKIKDILSGIGLTEVYNHSFVGEDHLKKIGIDYSSHIRLLNPISSHQTMLRQRLIPNLINNIRINQARYETIELFEIGSIYLSVSGEINKNNKTKEKLPFQERHLGIIVSSKGDVFRRAKGIVEYLLAKLNLEVSFIKTEVDYIWANKNIVADVKINNVDIGVVGKINNRVKNNFNLKREVAAIEINLRSLLNIIDSRPEKKYKEYEKYPPVIRDLAFVVDKNILYSDLKKAIINFSDIIKKVELFDVYEGERIGENKRSLAFHIIYQADRTLQSSEIDELQKGLVKELESKFEARLRDF